jgi:putative membrane protein
VVIPLSAAAEDSVAAELQDAGSQRIFSAQDLQRIRAAVRAAEEQTRGEIVPMVVQNSGRYEACALLGGLFAMLTLAGLLMFERESWGSNYSSALILLGVLLAYVVGHAAGSLPAMLRLVTPDDRMDLQVRRRAEAAFYEHGLHKTREGSGILIMISLLERRVQILADHAIDEKVPPATWDTVVQQLLQAIKEGRAAEGLCRAIAQCGALLAEHFPARRGDNPDELRNDLVQGR